MIRITLLTVFLGVLVYPAVGVAQYEEPREYGAQESRFFALGVISHEFRPRQENGAPDSLQIEFGRWAPTLSYSQGPVDVLFSYTRYPLRGMTRTAIHFGTTLSTEVPLIGKRPAALVLPICISGDFTKAESDAAEKDNFNVGSIGIGTGLQYRSAGAEVEFSVRALGAAHWSFEGYGSGNGSSMVITADARLLWRNPVLFDGIVFGYRFRAQTWTVGADRFNYRAVMHGPYVGALF